MVFQPGAHRGWFCRVSGFSELFDGHQVQISRAGRSVCLIPDGAIGNFRCSRASDATRCHSCCPSLDFRLFSTLDASECGIGGGDYAWQRHAGYSVRPGGRNRDVGFVVGTLSCSFLLSNLPHPSVWRLLGLFCTLSNGVTLRAGKSQWFIVRFFASVSLFAADNQDLAHGDFRLQGLPREPVLAGLGTKLRRHSLRLWFFVRACSSFSSPSRNVIAGGDTPSSALRPKTRSCKKGTAKRLAGVYIYLPLPIHPVATESSLHRTRQTYDHPLPR